jgi:high-affinity Fe2+/Pb2+ permease
MKINLTKKQKTVIFAGLILILLIIAVTLFFNHRKKTSSPVLNNSAALIKPVFMVSAEKAALNIKAETKVQVIKRSPDGKIMLYKVINNDSDIISNASQLAPPATHVKN